MIEFLMIGFLVICLGAIFQKILSTIMFFVNDMKEEMQLKRELYSIKRKIKK